jgi:hypothetical protein
LWQQICRHGAEWVDLGYVLRAEPLELAEGLDVGNEERGKIKDDSQLSNIDSQMGRDSSY